MFNINNITEFIEHNNINIKFIDYFEAGSQSDVFLIRYNNKDCVLKLYKNNNKFNENAFVLEKTVLNTLKDCDLAPKLLDTFEVDFCNCNLKFIIIEYLENYITLNKYMDSYPHQFKDLFFNLLNVLSKLHKKGVIHRDIKPNNIMVNKTTSDIKIIDFGLSYHVEETSDNYLLITSMAFDYQSPDLILHTMIENDNSRGNKPLKEIITQINKKNDLFSFLYLFINILSPHHVLFKRSGLLPDYCSYIKQEVNFSNIDDNKYKNYYKELKKYLLENINPLYENTNTSIKINELLKYFIINIDEPYDNILKFFETVKFE